MARYNLADGMHEDCVLLISCLGDNDTGGGLFCYDGDRVERVDRLSATGMALAGNLFMRSLWTPGGGPGEILVYDDKGVLNYLRIDDLWEPHDILWDGQHLVAVSSMQNTLLWISLSGQIVRRWHAPGVGDTWHLNCLLKHEGRLLVCAFGRFQKHREWTWDMNRATGIVFDPETDENVLDELSQPHHPRFLDGGWLICNSLRSELLRIDPVTQNAAQRLLLDGYTRGIGISDDFIFVGESAHRHVETRPHTAAKIAVICRHTWQILDRLQLPCREVYDLVVVPRPLAEGARRGFRTNPQRTAEQDQFAMFDAAGVQPARLWATGEPLCPEACRVKISVVLQAQMPRDSLIEIEYAVKNLGSAILVSAPPNPVYVSYKWFYEGNGGREEIEGLRTRLPYALSPGNSLSGQMKIQTPPSAGQFSLLITLVQEQVAWFSDLWDANGLFEAIEVV